mmetsp:Transcript_98826/g.213278  ORF Transcript_98826/g.213278 Transcript_98826/m.213278 type:complete len:635 (+) Transcript_98826:1847-3751(+)
MRAGAAANPALGLAVGHDVAGGLAAVAAAHGNPVVPVLDVLLLNVVGLPPVKVSDTRLAIPMAKEPVGRVGLQDAAPHRTRVARHDADGVLGRHHVAEGEDGAGGALEREDLPLGAEALLLVRDPRLRTGPVDTPDIGARAAVGPGVGVRVVVPRLEPVEGPRREALAEDHALRALAGPGVPWEPVVLLVVEGRGAGGVRDRAALLRARHPLDVEVEMRGGVSLLLALVNLLLIGIPIHEDVEDTLDAHQGPPLGLAVLLLLPEEGRRLLVQLLGLRVAAPVALVARAEHELGATAGRALQRLLELVALQLLGLPDLLDPQRDRPVPVVRVLGLLPPQLLGKPELLPVGEVPQVRREPGAVVVGRVLPRGLGRVAHVRLGVGVPAEDLELALLGVHQLLLLRQEVQRQGLGRPLLLLGAAADLVMAARRLSSAHQLADGAVGGNLGPLALEEVLGEGIGNLLVLLVCRLDLANQVVVDHVSHLLDELLHARRGLGRVSLDLTKAGHEAVDGGLVKDVHIASLVVDLEVLEGVAEEVGPNRHVDPVLHLAAIGVDVLEQVDEMPAQAGGLMHDLGALERGHIGRGTNDGADGKNDPKATGKLLHCTGVPGGSVSVDLTWSEVPITSPGICKPDRA